MKSKERAYQTILVIVLGFSLISWYLDIKELFYFALGINLISLVFSSVTLLIDKLWYGLAEFMGKNVSKIVSYIYSDLLQKRFQNRLYIYITKKKRFSVFL